jgi:hypothetical protein
MPEAKYRVGMNVQGECEVVGVFMKRTAETQRAQRERVKKRG